MVHDTIRSLELQTGCSQFYKGFIVNLSIKVWRNMGMKNTRFIPDMCQVTDDYVQKQFAKGGDYVSRALIWC